MLAEDLHRSCMRWPARAALRYRGCATSYRELGTAVAALADAYDRQGIRAGDRIICALDNGPDYVIAMMAAWLHGAVHVGVSSDLPKGELRRIARFTSARATVRSGCSSLAGPDASGGSDGAVVALLDGEGGERGSRPLSDCLADGGRHPAAPRADAPRASARAPARVPTGALATLFLTHGTTGQPKFPVSYQRTLAERWGKLAELLGHGPDDVHLAHLPMSHGFGLMMSVTALLTGGCLVFPASSSIEEALALVATERVSVISGSPVLYRLMIDRRDKLDLRTVRMAIGSAAPFELPLLRQVVDGLGLRFMLMYGASEGVGVVTTDRDDILRGAVGIPQSGSVAIVDADHRPLPIGAVGEIAFSRAAYPVAYWDGQSARGQGAWYYSGDLGRFDEAGRLYVVGRCAHQINRAGLKIDPLAIEAAIRDIGEASDVAVVGIPDPILGEIACACVVPRAGTAVVRSDLHDDLTRALGPSRCPDRIVTVERIPRSRVGKVDFADLRAMLSGARPG